MASDYLSVNAFYHLIFIFCENFNFKLLHRQELVKNQGLIRGHPGDFNRMDRISRMKQEWGGGVKPL
jgi:hypothetical protein